MRDVQPASSLQIAKSFTCAAKNENVRLHQDNEDPGNEVDIDTVRRTRKSPRIPAFLLDTEAASQICLP